MASFEFLVPIDRASSLSLRDQLYRALREAILNGGLPPGVRLPSSRQVARQAGVARQTVVEAYDQLVAEGYATARPASGTYAAETLPDDLLQARPRRRGSGRNQSTSSGVSKRGAQIAATPSSASVDTAVPRPFQTATPALDRFPFDLWARLYRQHLASRSVELLGYGEHAGYRPLREALAAYVRSVRAARCSAEQVIITSGSQQSLNLAAQVLLDPGDTVWMEEPSYVGARAAMLAAGAHIVPVPVDAEGLDVLAGSDRFMRARMVLLTPSRQYPLGMVMSLQRRRAVLDWAERVGAWVLEDDYDSEFRYTGRPLASLQGLDPNGRVVYLGTLSKVLFPSLRLGFVIVPPDLVDAFTKARALADRHSPTVDQAVLAEFIAEGHLARHIRRMRALYAERHDALLRLARRRLDGLLDVKAAEAGMHLVGWLPEGVDDVEVSEQASAAGVVAPPLSRHYLGAPPARRALLLGFTAYSEPQLAAAVARLATVLQRHPGISRSA